MLVVQFTSFMLNRAVESEGPITFTVSSLVPSDRPFSVQVCTTDGDTPLTTAKGLLKTSLT